MQQIRYVVVHTPGAAWEPNVPAFQQKGLQAHVDYYKQLLDAGNLFLGGPFMDESSGGLMMFEIGVPEDTVRTWAAEDPAVKSGLLSFEVRPWYAALHR